MGQIVTPNAAAVLPFTARISGHDAQGLPWTREYLFDTAETAYTVDDVEAEQLALVYTAGQPGAASVPALEGVDVPDPTDGGGGGGGGSGGGGTPGHAIWLPTAYEDNGGFANPEGLFTYGGDYATITTSTAEIKLTDFVGDAIPDGATITSVNVNVDRQVASTSSTPFIMATVHAPTELPLFDEEQVTDTAMGVHSTDFTAEAAWDQALLESAFVILRVRNADDAPPDTAWTVDDVRFRIDYTEAPPEGTPESGTSVWFPTAFDDDAGWTNLDNVFDEDGVFATLTTAAAVEVNLTDFAGDEVLEEATITGVRLVFDRKVASAAGEPRAQADLYANGIELEASLIEEAVADTSLAPFVVDYTNDVDWDLTALNSTHVIFRVRNVDGAPPSTAWSVDDVRLEIDWTTATGGGGGGGPGPGVGDPNLPAIAGKDKLYEDDCSHADPLLALKWAATDGIRGDGQLDHCSGDSDPYNHSTEYDAGGTMADLIPGQFVWHSSGGPNGGPYYTLNSTVSRYGVFACPPTARSAIGYPKFNPGNKPSPQPGPTGAGFLYQGRELIYCFSTRLHTNWDTDLNTWRLLAQWKQNEFVSVHVPPYGSPALALEQRNGQYVVTQYGGPILWSVDMSEVTADSATENGWINWGVRILGSGSAGTGKLQVYADFDNDGDYEYDGGLITAATMVPASGSVASRSTAVENMFSPGVYEGGASSGSGGDSADFARFSIWGTFGA